MEDAGCKLELALTWTVTAKNSLKNVNDFSPNQLVLGVGGNPNFLTALYSKFPTLKGKSTGENVANDISAMHTVRKTFIQSESSERIRCAL